MPTFQQSVFFFFTEQAWVWGHELFYDRSQGALKPFLTKSAFEADTPYPGLADRILNSCLRIYCLSPAWVPPTICVVSF